MDDDSTIEYGEDENVNGTEHIMRLPSKEEQQKRTQKSEQKKDTADLHLESLTEVKQMLKTLNGKADKMKKSSSVSADKNQKTVREKSHNHKPQPFPDTKRKRK